MRLKYIAQVDFRKSEQTNFEIFQKKHESIATSLNEEDVLLLINHGENQLVFIHGFKRLVNSYNHPVRILSSRRLRISGGTWNPLMLQNYATEVGMDLGLKSFEQFYKKLKG